MIYREVSLLISSVLFTILVAYFYFTDIIFNFLEFVFKLKQLKIQEMKYIIK